MPTLFVVFYTPDGCLVLLQRRASAQATRYRGRIPSTWGVISGKLDEAEQWEVDQLRRDFQESKDPNERTSILEKIEAVERRCMARELKEEAGGGLRKCGSKFTEIGVPSRLLAMKPDDVLRLTELSPEGDHIYVAPLNPDQDRDYFCESRRHVCWVPKVEKGHMIEVDLASKHYYALTPLRRFLDHPMTPVEGSSCGMQQYLRCSEDNKEVEVIKKLEPALEELRLAMLQNQIGVEVSDDESTRDGCSDDQETPECKVEEVCLCTSEQRKGGLPPAYRAERQEQAKPALKSLRPGGVQGKAKAVAQQRDQCTQVSSSTRSELGEDIAESRHCCSGAKLVADVVWVVVLHLSPWRMEGHVL
mmetsp:Transcript_22957/g.58895  ORF Transcript_22957/g.58895 Transcript_22957/m.58895 type:complete len:361 (-) Transcript_22957:140-1222(-)